MRERERESKRERERPGVKEYKSFSYLRMIYKFVRFLFNTVLNKA